MQQHAGRQTATFEVDSQRPGLPLGLHWLLLLRCHTTAACRLCPMQDRLDAKAKEFKAERAKMAESEIMRMEVRCWHAVLLYRRGPFLPHLPYYLLLLPYLPHLFFFVSPHLLGKAT
jgi:hypothetical protein